MRKTSRRSCRSMYLTSLYRLQALVFAALLFFLGLTACIFSFSSERQRLLTENNAVLNQLTLYFESKIEDFYTLYLPLLQNSRYRAALMKFYTAPDEEIVSPFLLQELKEALAWASQQDPNLRFLLLWRNTSTPRMYMFEPGSELSTGSLKGVPADYTFGERLQQKSAAHEVYGSIPWDGGRVFAISGNAPQPAANGALLGAFDMQGFDKILATSPISNDARFVVALDSGEIIYDSWKLYEDIDVVAMRSGNILRDESGNLLYCTVIERQNYSFLCFYTVSWIQLLRTASSGVLLILGSVVLFLVMTLCINNISRTRISRRIETINHGIDVLSRNLQARIADSGQNDELDSITNAINNMASELEENMYTLYEYKVRHKTDELMMLQARINPHFLYNALEILRGRMEASGDPESANMVSHIGKLLRRFIDDRLFFTISEEMSMLRMYLELFKAQRDENVRVEFDIPGELLHLGIIRNLMQPLVENYILHGFLPDANLNLVRIEGRRVSEAFLELSVRDNGRGIGPEALADIRERLAGVRDSESELTHYGLLSVHERIRLFYGDECGVKIEALSEGGTQVTLRIRAMTYQEHEVLLRA